MKIKVKNENNSDIHPKVEQGIRLLAEWMVEHIKSSDSLQQESVGLNIKINMPREKHIQNNIIKEV